ncbi:MAG: PD-(D/E)XK nuclease family protein [Opitutales bacterium]|jgi:ATP-dependent helicase/nuclease subunit B
MEIRRHYIGWKKPFILEFSQRLLAEAGGERSLDEWLIWVPSARAGRHILNELFQADDEVEAFHPPRLMTPAQFTASLKSGPGVASETQRLFAWKTVIMKAGEERLRPLFPFIPEENRTDWAYGVASQLIRMRDRLGEEGSHFVDIPQRAPGMDSARWECLGKLEQAYCAELSKLGLRDPDQHLQARCREALIQQPFKRLLVAGILNLSRRQRELVGKLQELGVAVDFYLPVPEELAGTLDPLGRPMPEFWKSRAVPGALLESRIHRAPDPRILTRRVLDLADLYSGSVDALVVGAPEEETSRFLVERSRLTSSPFYAPQGTPLARTGMGRLIALVLECGNDPSLDQLLALLQHALLRKWARSAGLDVGLIERAILRLKKDHLLSSVSRMKDPALKPIGAIASVKEFLEAVNGLTQLAGGGQSLPESVWKMLQTVVRCGKLSPSQVQVFGQIEEILQDLNSEFGHLLLDHPDQRALLENQLKSHQFYPERESGERPVAGWLELPWELAPHLVILGLPDSEVPGRDMEDSILTPTLCRACCFYGPDDAVAFHAFRLRLILESRQDWGKLDILLPDRNLGDDPELATRFLFQAEPGEVRERVIQLLEDKPVQEEPVPASFGKAIQLPTPEPLTRMSVTGFRSYLANPLGFFLERRLGWEAPQPYPAELDALQFGNLGHEVMEALNSDSAGKSITGEKDIAEFLSDTLDGRMGEIYGSSPSVPLQIQRESMRERLAAAAAIIARERQRGWVPFRVEWPFHKDMEMVLEGVSLRGKIDLLERNEETGKYRIIDYKTSDKNEPPMRTHISSLNASSGKPLFPETDFLIGDKSYRWKDLQLPLYQEGVLRFLGEEAECGYLCLGKAVKDIELNLWTPDSGIRSAALECAGAILRRISEGIFPLPSRPSPYDSWLPWFNMDYAGTIDPVWMAKHGGGAS